MFDVDIRTFQRWLSCYRQTGRTAQLPRGHRHAAFEGKDLKRLDELIAEHPDATLEEPREMSGTLASIMSVKRAADRLGCRFKKRCTPASKAFISTADWPLCNLLEAALASLSL